MKLFRTNKIDTDEYKIGDVIFFNLTDGEEVEAMAVKQEKNGMLFLLVDCLRNEYAINQENTNYGGFYASNLRATLKGEILDRFPANLRKKMIAFKNGSLLRLPTEREIFGENKFGQEEPKTVTQWKPMKLRKNRIASQGKNGTWEWYWLTNKRRADTTNFVRVDGCGFASYGYASALLGIRPVFKIQNHIPHGV